MSDAGFFKGTSSDQDNRFTDKNKRLMKTMKFADAIAKKVDMTKVNLDTIKPWITRRITELLGFEDDVVIEFIFNQLEERNPDGRQMQMNLTGFLNAKNARTFIQELWELLLSAQENIGGIPAVFLEQKKEEIKMRQAEQERLRETLKAQEEAIREAITKEKKDKESSKERYRSKTPPPKRKSRFQSRSRSGSPEPAQTTKAEVIPDVVKSCDLSGSETTQKNPLSGSEKNDVSVSKTKTSDKLDSSSQKSPSSSPKRRYKSRSRSRSPRKKDKSRSRSPRHRDRSGSAKARGAQSPSRDRDRKSPRRPTSQSRDLHEHMASQKPSMVEVVIHRHHHDVVHQHSNARVSHHDDASHHRHDDGTHLLQGAGRAHPYADLGHRHRCLVDHVNLIAARDLQYSRQPRRHLTIRPEVRQLHLGDQLPYHRNLGRQVQCSKADITGHMLRPHRLTAHSLLQDSVHVKMMLSPSRQEDILGEHLMLQQQDRDGVHHAGCLHHRADVDCLLSAVQALQQADRDVAPAAAHHRDQHKMFHLADAQPDNSHQHLHADDTRHPIDCLCHHQEGNAMLNLCNRSTVLIADNVLVLRLNKDCLQRLASVPGRRRRHLMKNIRVCLRKSFQSSTLEQVQNNGVKQQVVSVIKAAVRSVAQADTWTNNADQLQKDETLVQRDDKEQVRIGVQD